MPLSDHIDDHRPARSITDLAQLRGEFEGGNRYLNACTMGIPTRRIARIAREGVDAWERAGVGPADYAVSVENSRRLFSRLMGVAPERVAIGSQTSVFAGMIAASLPAGARVICVDGDFSSMVYPFLVQQPRIVVESVPLHDLARHIVPGVSMVAFSLVQSADGAVADVEAIVRESARVGALTVCDTTQAAGSLPVDATVFDITICNAYKWLLCPRGVAFMTVGEHVQDRLVPVFAGWYAGADVWQSMYGPDMCLAGDARRFDVSPAWPSWPGAEAALELLAGLDIGEVSAANAGRANRLRDRLGLRSEATAIVSWEDADGEDYRRLSGAGFALSSRRGRVRVSFHLWNDDAEVEELIGVIGGR